MRIKTRENHLKCVGEREREQKAISISSSVFVFVFFSFYLIVYDCKI